MIWRKFRGWSHQRLSRLAILLAVIGVALTPILALAADSPYSTISPQSKQAREDTDLYSLVFWLALIVFIGVEALLIYVAMKYRRKAAAEGRPEQSHGNRSLEIVWTIIPAIILLIVFIPTVQNIYARADDAESGEYVVEIYGKQWWWEVHYKEPDAVANIVTGNEIHLPVGKKVLFKLYSNNVIHSFWVPRLSGKMDLIPGHENRIGLDTTDVGYFYGQCAEFCGDDHALMQFKVIVEPQEQFDKWVAAYQAGPSQKSAQYTGGDVTQAPEALGICLTCHMISGVTKNAAGADAPQLPTGLNAAKTFGPNLAMFACHTTIAAGTLPNDPEGENLRAWLNDPGKIKPGNYMSTVIQPDTLSDQQIEEIVGYLQSLEPEGGCEPLPESAEGGNVEPTGRE